MKRAESIEALLKKVKRDFAELKLAYNASLHEKHVRADLKVAIKNICENLRSCLDYLAQDAFETHCSASPKPDRLYFPIRSSPADFSAAVSKGYPRLSAASPAAFKVIEAAQPYCDPWLGQFNKLNNRNKHEDLAEQTRTESKRVTVSRDGGPVSWGSGVTFRSGVSVMGVPIDPRTQMPVPNNVARTEVVTWIDFRFKEIDQPVLGFVEVSVAKVEALFASLRPHI
jgi:hypothetical protein